MCSYLWWIISIFGRYLRVCLLSDVGSIVQVVMAIHFSLNRTELPPWDMPLRSCWAWGVTWASGWYPTRKWGISCLRVVLTLKTAAKPLSQGWVHRCLGEEVSKRALKDCVLSQWYFVWFWCNRSIFHPLEKEAKRTVTATGNQSCWNKDTEQMHYTCLLWTGVYRRPCENTWTVAKMEIPLKVNGTAALN